MRKTDDLAIECRCGAVRGIARAISPRVGNRVICYCDDCQAYARHLQNETMLDANGGTDIFQMSAGRLRFDQGQDRLACLRLTQAGPLRWYASCCKTPIGNTLATRQLPFLGLTHCCMDPGGQSLDTVLGPVRMRVMARYASGDRSKLIGAHDGFPLSIFAGTAWRLLRWRLAGDHRRSPFFDADSGRPLAEPQSVNQ
jgi:hypothetical protein